MKRQIKYLLAFLVAAVSLFAVSFMIENPMIVRINRGFDAKTIEMHLANLQKQRTHIAIQDMSGKFWFSEYVWNEQGYAKKYNLSALPEGNYLCFVQNAKGMYTQAFRVDMYDVAFFKMTDPAEAVKSRLMYAGSEKPAMLRITNEDNTSIGLQIANLQRQYTVVQLSTFGEPAAFEQKISGKEALAERINLDGMVAGNYFLYLKIGDASLIQQVEWSPGALKLGKQEQFDFVPVIPEDVVVQ